MAVRTQQELLDLIQSELPDNTSRRIRGNDLRDRYYDAVESFGATLVARGFTAPSEQVGLLSAIAGYINNDVTVTQDAIRHRHLNIVEHYAQHIVDNSGSVTNRQAMQDDANTALADGATVRPCDLRRVLADLVTNVFAWCDTLAPAE